MNAQLQTETETETQQVKTPVEINVIAMHERPHLDEAVAYVLLVMYGEKLFPGISKAGYRFLTKALPGNDQAWDANKILPIGIGKGRFDEHRDGLPTGRIEGECTATLVAKYLGVQDNPELKSLLAETLAGDEGATNTSTQIAELMKVSYRYLQGDSTIVFNMIVVAIRAVINHQMFPFAATQTEKPLKQLWREALDQDDDLKAQPKVVSRIGQLIGESMTRKDKLVTELSAVIEAMYRFPYPFDKTIGPQFEFWLAAIKNDTVEFQILVEDFKKIRPIEVRVCNGRDEWEVCLLVCNTDTQQAPKVARYLGNSITLLRTPKGNFQIFTDNRTFGDRQLSIANIVRMLRWLELSPDQQEEVSRLARPGEKGKLTWQSLGSSGEHPAVPDLYYHSSAENVYNGSTTHLAKPSNIGTQAIIEVIKYGMHPHYLKIWCRDRNIIMHPEKVFKKTSRREDAQKVGFTIEIPNPSESVADLEAALEEKSERAS